MALKYKGPDTRVPNKDPDSIGVVYGFDHAAWLKGDDSIASSSWTVPSDLTVLSDSIEDAVTLVKLSGGIKGTKYQLTNTVITVDGVQDNFSFVLWCEQK